LDGGHMGRSLQPDRMILLEGSAKVRASLEGPHLRIEIWGTRLCGPPA
jgi:hypothetical protein